MSNTSIPQPVAGGQALHVPVSMDDAATYGFAAMTVLTNLLNGTALIRLRDVSGYQWCPKCETPLERPMLAAKLDREQAEQIGLALIALARYAPECAA